MTSERSKTLPRRPRKKEENVGEFKNYPVTKESNYTTVVIGSCTSSLTLLVILVIEKIGSSPNPNKLYFVTHTPVIIISTNCHPLTPAGGVVHKIPVPSSTVNSSEEDYTAEKSNTLKSRKRQNKRSSWSISSKSFKAHILYNSNSGKLCTKKLNSACCLLKLRSPGDKAATLPKNIRFSLADLDENGTLKKKKNKKPSRSTSAILGFKSTKTKISQFVWIPHYEVLTITSLQATRTSPAAPCTLTPARAGCPSWEGAVSRPETGGGAGSS